MAMKQAITASEGLLLGAGTHPEQPVEIPLFATAGENRFDSGLGIEGIRKIDPGGEDAFSVRTTCSLAMPPSAGHSSTMLSADSHTRNDRRVPSTKDRSYHWNLPLPPRDH